MSDIKLGGFDDPGDDGDFDLRPRKNRRATKPQKSAEAPSETPAEPQAPPPDPTPEPATRGPSSAGAKKQQPATSPTPTEKVSDQVQKMTASNLQVPASLMEQIKQVRTEEGLTTGQLFIVAIETTYEDLKAAFEPKSTGGSLFSSSSRKIQRPDKGPLAQLNFRMLSADIDVLDRLVAEFGLESRGHLVSEALEKYFDRKGDR